MTDTAQVTDEKLRAVVERIEAQAARIQDEKDGLKAIYAEAKGEGYDVKVIRKIVAMRKKRADDLAEEEAMIDIYKAALGMV